MSKSEACILHSRLLKQTTFLTENQKNLHQNCLNWNAFDRYGISIFCKSNQVDVHVEWHEFCKRKIWTMNIFEYYIFHFMRSTLRMTRRIGNHQPDAILKLILHSSIIIHIAIGTSKWNEFIQLLTSIYYITCVLFIENKPNVSTLFEGQYKMHLIYYVTTYSSKMQIFVLNWPWSIAFCDAWVCIFCSNKISKQKYVFRKQD